MTTVDTKTGKREGKSHIKENTKHQEEQNTKECRCVQSKGHLKNLSKSALKLQALLTSYFSFEFMNSK